jgi:hypothetical protein
VTIAARSREIASIVLIRFKIEMIRTEIFKRKGIVYLGDIVSLIFNQCLYFSRIYQDIQKGFERL